MSPLRLRHRLAASATPLVAPRRVAAGARGPAAATPVGATPHAARRGRRPAAAELRRRTPHAAASRRRRAAATRAQVSKGAGTLPNDHGQVWREYDITPYTIRVDSTEHPEQAIVDWILRETGYEAWHSTPVGLLSADRKVLRVYHTPQMQAVVAEIVDRFVSTQAQNHGFGLRIITMKNPNWRVRALPLMTSIPVQSPGVQGWIMAREDAALLLAELRRRTDFREHTTPNQMVLNGQSSVVSTMRPHHLRQGHHPHAERVAGLPARDGADRRRLLAGVQPAALDRRRDDRRGGEAASSARSRRCCRCSSKCPAPVAQNQKAQIEVPQLTMVQLHERFRWPTDHVLLLSMGVVATPGPEKPNPVMDVLPLPKSAPRADALLMVESTARSPQATPAPGTGAARAVETASLPDRTFHGRY